MKRPPRIIAKWRSPVKKPYFTTLALNWSAQLERGEEGYTLRCFKEGRQVFVQSHPAEWFREKPPFPETDNDVRKQAEVWAAKHVDQTHIIKMERIV